MVGDGRRVGTTTATLLRIAMQAKRMPRSPHFPVFMTRLSTPVPAQPEPARAGFAPVRRVQSRAGSNREFLSRVSAPAGVNPGRSPTGGSGSL